MVENITLLKSIGRASKVLENHFNERIAAHELNLTRVQFIALKVISLEEYTSQNKVAFITSRDKSSLVRLLNTLEKKGFITRSPSPDDKRVNLLKITGTGRKELEKVAPVIREVEQHVTEGLNQNDINTTIRVLSQVFEKVKPENFV